MSQEDCPDTLPMEESTMEWASDSQSQSEDDSYIVSQSPPDGSKHYMEFGFIGPYDKDIPVTFIGPTMMGEKIVRRPRFAYDEGNDVERAAKNLAVLHSVNKALDSDVDQVTSPLYQLDETIDPESGYRILTLFVRQNQEDHPTILLTNLAFFATRFKATNPHRCPYDYATLVGMSDAMRYPSQGMFDEIQKLKNLVDDYGVQLPHS